MILLIGLTPPHICVCSEPGPGFLTSCVVIMCCDYQKCKLNELLIDLNNQDKVKMGYILIMGGKSL